MYDIIIYDTCSRASPTFDVLEFILKNVLMEEEDGVEADTEDEIPKPKSRKGGNKDH